MQTGTGPEEAEDDRRIISRLPPDKSRLIYKKGAMIYDDDA